MSTISNTTAFPATPRVTLGSKDVFEQRDYENANPCCQYFIIFEKDVVIGTEVLQCRAGKVGGNFNAWCRIEVETKIRAGMKPFDALKNTPPHCLFNTALATHLHTCPLLTGPQRTEAMKTVPASTNLIPVNELPLFLPRLSRQSVADRTESLQSINVEAGKGLHLEYFGLRQLVGYFGAEKMDWNDRERMIAELLKLVANWNPNNLSTCPIHFLTRPDCMDWLDALYHIQDKAVLDQQVKRVHYTPKVDGIEKTPYDKAMGLPATVGGHGLKVVLSELRKRQHFTGQISKVTKTDACEKEIANAVFRNKKKATDPGHQQAMDLLNALSGGSGSAKRELYSEPIRQARKEKIERWKLANPDTVAKIDAADAKAQVETASRTAAATGSSASAPKTKKKKGSSSKSGQAQTDIPSFYVNAAASSSKADAKQDMAEPIQEMEDEMEDEMKVAQNGEWDEANHDGTDIEMVDVEDMQKAVHEGDSEPDVDSDDSDDSNYSDDMQLQIDESPETVHLCNRVWAGLVAAGYPLCRAMTTIVINVCRVFVEMRIYAAVPDIVQGLRQIKGSSKELKRLGRLTEFLAESQDPLEDMLALMGKCFPKATGATPTAYIAIGFTKKPETVFARMRDNNLQRRSGSKRIAVGEFIEDMAQVEHNAPSDKYKAIFGYPGVTNKGADERSSSTASTKPGSGLNGPALEGLRLLDAGRRVDRMTSARQVSSLKRNDEEDNQFSRFPTIPTGVTQSWQSYGHYVSVCETITFGLCGGRGIPLANVAPPGNPPRIDAGSRVRSFAKANKAREGIKHTGIMFNAPPGTYHQLNPDGSSTGPQMAVLNACAETIVAPEQFVDEHEPQLELHYVDLDQGAEDLDAACWTAHPMELVSDGYRRLSDACGHEPSVVIVNSQRVFNSLPEFRDLSPWEKKRAYRSRLNTAFITDIDDEHKARAVVLMHEPIRSTRAQDQWAARDALNHGYTLAYTLAYNLSLKVSPTHSPADALEWFQAVNSAFVEDTAAKAKTQRICAYDDLAPMSTPAAAPVAKAGRPSSTVRLETLPACATLKVGSNKFSFMVDDEERVFDLQLDFRVGGVQAFWGQIDVQLERSSVNSRALFARVVEIRPNRTDGHVFDDGYVRFLKVGHFVGQPAKPKGRKVSGEVQIPEDEEIDEDDQSGADEQIEEGEQTVSGLKRKTRSWGSTVTNLMAFLDSTPSWEEYHDSMGFPVVIAEQVGDAGAGRE